MSEHWHTTRVPGCFRCEMGEDEAKGDPMTDPIARTRELLAGAREDETLEVLPSLLTELADACEAKDAEIERLREALDSISRPHAYGIAGAFPYGRASAIALAALSDTGGEG